MAFGRKVDGLYIHPLTSFSALLRSKMSPCELSSQYSNANPTWDICPWVTLCSGSTFCPNIFYLPFPSQIVKYYPMLAFVPLWHLSWCIFLGCDISFNSQVEPSASRPDPTLATTSCTQRQNITHQWIGVKKTGDLCHRETIVTVWEERQREKDRKYVADGSNITIQVKKKCERNVTVTSRPPLRRVNVNLCNPWSLNVLVDVVN